MSEPSALLDRAVRLSLEDIAAPPRERFALGVMLPFEKASVLYGPTSVGKSALAAQVVFAFAAGAESLWSFPLYRDEETDEHGGPVLVYSAEDTLDDWKRKAAAIRMAGGLDVERACERLWVVDQSEGLARLSEAVTYREPVSPETPERIVTRRVPRATDEQENLIEMVRAVGADLVLVETASRLVDEEDNPSFAALQSALGRIARETGAAVLLTHHATKAASKENDNAIESARGGGSLIANARCALALFPAEPDAAKPYHNRFPAEDIVTLAHVKGTSSTRRSAPLVLVRTGTDWGAVFRRPDEVALTPEQQEANEARMALQRRREAEQLGRLFDVVAKVLPMRPLLSPSWLRDNAAKDLGLAKHKIEPLVHRALEADVLRVYKRTERGITVTLGLDPRKPIGDRASPGESTEDAA